MLLDSMKGIGLPAFVSMGPMTCDLWDLGLLYSGMAFVEDTC